MDPLSIISSIPPNTNPYLYLENYLKSSVVPATGGAYAANLVICSVLQALALLLALLLLLNKSRNEEVWIIKRKMTSHGVLWLPNSALLFIFFSIIYLLVAQVDAWSQRQCVDHNDTVVLLSTYIVPYKILALFAALWSETYGYFASVFLYKYEGQRKTSGRALAKLFNAFFIFGYVWNFVPAFVLAIVAPIEFDKGYSFAQELLASLQVAAADWDGKAGLRIQPSWLGLFDKFYSHLTEHLHLLEITYQLYLALFLLITSLYLIAALLYTRCLRHQVNRDFVQLDRAHFNGQGTRSRHTAALRLAYRLLLAKAACIGVMAILLVALVMAPVVNYKAFYESVRLYSIVVAGQFYPFGICGLAILAIQAYGTWNNEPTLEQAQHGVRQALGLPFSIVDQISIQTETAVAIDQATEEDSIAMKPRYTIKQTALVKQADEKSMKSFEDFGI